MTPLWPGDGDLYFNTYRRAAKARMMMRDGRVGFVAFDATEPRMVAATADAILITAPDEIVALADTAVRELGVPPEVVQRTRQRLIDGKRVLFRMAVQHAVWLDVPAGLRATTSSGRHGGARSDTGKGGRDRDALGLDPAAIQSLLAASPAGAVAHIGEDGYPNVTVCGMAFDGSRVRLIGSSCVAGQQVCLVVDRGGSYAEIVGAVVRGQLAGDLSLGLDDVVSFDFAKIAG